jgi:general nucleoside transport system permease protein
MDTLLLLLASAVDAGTAIALAGLGLLINERVGIVNLGAEGIMLVAALTGFAVAVHTDNQPAAFLAAAGAGACMAFVFGVLVIGLDTNQYATGLALSLFGAGFSAFAGQDYTQAHLGARTQSGIPGLSEIPLIGAVLFRHHTLAFAAVAFAAGFSFFLFRSKSGLVLRAIGESPDAARSLGYPVRRIRLAAVAAGGALTGIAGAYLSLVDTPLWVEGMVSGKGWIALALTTFATWRPWRVLFGAYLFGGVTMLQFHLQARGVDIPSQFLTMLPYVATVVVLAVISRNPAWIRLNMPASLGKPFSRNA